MMTRRLRRNHPPPENHERWMVSYADFITLLFALFVVMYAISSVNEGKYRVLSTAMADAFRTVSSKPYLASAEALSSIRASQEITEPVLPYRIAPELRPLPVARSETPPLAEADPAVADEALCAEETHVKASDESREDKSEPATISADVVPEQAVDEAKPVPPEVAPVPVSDPDPMQPLVARLQASVAELIDADLVQVRREGGWIELEIRNHMLFNSGSSVIDGDAVTPLEEIAAVLRDVPNRIHVEGFTDDVPIQTPFYPSNWELSAARAASVVHLLMEQGLAPERMAAVGYGEHRPIASNATAEGRMRNRRVVLVILDDTTTGRRIHETAAIASPGEQVVPAAVDTAVLPSQDGTEGIN